MKFIKDEFELAISSKLKYGSGFRLVSPARSEMRADGKVRVEVTHSYQRREYELEFSNLTDSDYSALRDFIINTVDWASSQFVFEDDDGVQWNAKIINRDYDFNPVEYKKRTGSIVIATQPSGEGWGGWGDGTEGMCFKRYYRGYSNPGKSSGTHISPSYTGAYYITVDNFANAPEACWCRSSWLTSFLSDTWYEFDANPGAIDYIEGVNKTWNAPGFCFALTAPGVSRSSNYGAALTGVFFQLRAGKASRSGISFKVLNDGNWQYGQYMTFDPLPRFTTTRVRIEFTGKTHVKMWYGGVLKLDFPLVPTAAIGDTARVEFGAATIDTNSENFFGNFSCSLLS